MSFDFSNFSPEHREYFVFYTDDQMVIYEDHHKIIQQTCSGEILQEVSAPAEYRHYEIVDLDDRLLLILSGRYLYIFAKNGESVEIPTWQPEITGVIVKVSNQLFATALFGKHYQIVSWDLINHRRIFQTSSFHAESCDAFIVNKNAYLMLGQSSL